MKNSLLLLVILVLAGCATQPVLVKDAEDVPAKRCGPAFAKYSVSREGYARLTIVRDSGMVNAAVPMLVSIEGEELATFRPKERVVIFLPPGQYIASLQPKPILGGSIEEQHITVVAGKDYFYRIAASMTGGDGLMPTTLVK